MLAHTIENMPSVKRCRLLSDLERERLLNRGSLDRHTRVTNDIRVRRKLADWLNGVEDVSLILDHLPKDDIQKIACQDAMDGDPAVYRLALSTVEMFRTMGHRPIIGDVGHPEGWQTITNKLDKIEKVPATDADINGAAQLMIIVAALESMLGSQNNPVAYAVKYRLTRDNPTIAGILEGHTDILKDYQVGLERVIKATESEKTKRRERKSNKK
jgi:hypothetical protein